MSKKKLKAKFGQANRAERIAIGSLKGLPSSSVYTRRDGQLYLKLDAERQVRVEISKNKKMWTAVGCTEKLDPKEEVVLVQG